MDATVDRLEAKFSCVDSSIDLLEAKLDYEFGRTAEDNCAKIKKNPVKLLETLQHIQKEFTGIVDEVKTIQKEHQETVMAVQGELGNMMEKLSALNMTAGIESQEHDEVPVIEELTGSKIQPTSEQASSSAPAHPMEPTSTASRPTYSTSLTSDVSPEYVSPSVPNERCKNTALCTENVTPKNAHGNPLVFGPVSTPKPAGFVYTEDSEEGDTITLPAATLPCHTPTHHKPEEEPAYFNESAFDRRMKSSAFLPINDEEFHSVSNLIRNQVKLSDVNQVYKVLHQEFKVKHNSAPISTKELHELGVKITGHTGQAKLQVLRALKLITMSRSGDVTLL